MSPGMKDAVADSAMSLGMGNAVRDSAISPGMRNAVGDNYGRFYMLASLQCQMMLQR